MQFITAALLALVVPVLSLPPSAFQELDQSEISSEPALQSKACGPLSNKAVCCRKSLLGTIDFDCHRPKPEPKSGPELAAACEPTGKMPRCCILGILGHYLACKPPLGFFNYTEDSVQAVGTDQYWDLELM